jgi:hypothetical protein
MASLILGPKNLNPKILYHSFHDAYHHVNRRTESHMKTPWRKHDAGFFTLELPTDWALQDRAAGAVILQDNRREITVNLHAISKPSTPNLGLPARHTTPREAQYELQKFTDTFKTITFHHAPRVVPNARHTMATTEGVQRIPTLPWYRRIFRKNPLTLHRFWAILNPHLLVLASVSGPPQLLEKFRPLLDRILASINLPDKDLLLGRHFTDKVISLARAYFPELSLAIIDDAHLRCGSAHVSLTPLHRRYLAAPEDLPTHVRSFFAEVQHELPASERAHSWAAARRHILPTFMPEHNVNHSNLQYESWVNDLAITYLLEDAGDQRPVTTIDVKRWKIDPETLHQQALKNLIHRSHEHTMEVHKSEGYTMLLLVAPEKHNAVRILLPELHSILREHLGPTFFAAIPTHEFLLAFATQNEEILTKVRQQIAADHSRAKNPISPKLFLITPDGITGDPTEEEDFDL